MQFFTKKIFTACFLLLVICQFFSVSVSFAAEPPNLRAQISDQVSAGNSVAGLGNAKPEEVVARVIQIFLSLVGVTFTALIVLSGYNLLTAAGDESKVEKAKNTIKACIIGLAVTLSAYSITTFIGSSAVEITNQDPAPAESKKGFDYFFGNEE